ncbi:MAG TPA: tellurite resistance TerB family protein [Myxococcales bacterium]|jgi:tellurite resistance protein
MDLGSLIGKIVSLVSSSSTNTLTSAASAHEPPLLMGLALLSAMSDGSVGMREVAWVGASLASNPLLAMWDQAKTAAVAKDIQRKYATPELATARALELADKVTDPKQRELVYGLAALCAASDKVFSPLEARYLRKLQQKWGLSDETANKVHVGLELPPPLEE